MFNIRDEGKRVKQGFNFYPMSSNHFGFVFKFKTTTWYFRYAKLIQKFKIHKHSF